ncbi:MAG: NAD(+)/NADH kinase [Syntrophomonadaceae bacterium]|nr:NAD(+)/NADH kinase [Syntrophomonadaceae bacterium]
MKKIGIMTNNHRTDAIHFSEFVSKKLREENIEVWFEQDPGYDPTNTDLLMLLGGDGTLLRAFHKFGKMEIPYLSINFGNIGFLSTIEPDDFLQYLPLILKENYRIEERISMYVSVLRGGQNEVFSDHAFNDVVVKSVVPRISRQALRIDGTFFSQYEGDGIICATATGSTAYSLSAGGAIVDPALDAFTLTPICSRANLMNSMVLSAQHNLEILCRDFHPCCILSIDGREYINLVNNDRIKIQKSSLKIKLVQFHQDRYFNHIHPKLLCVH